MAGVAVAHLRCLIPTPEARCLVVADHPVDLGPLLRLSRATAVTVHLHDNTCRWDPIALTDERRTVSSFSRCYDFENLRAFGVFGPSPSPDVRHLDTADRLHLNNLVFDGVTADVLWIAAEGRAGGAKNVFDDYLGVLNEGGYLVLDRAHPGDVAHLAARFREGSYPGRFERVDTRGVGGEATTVFQRLPTPRDVRFAVVTMTYKRASGKSRGYLEQMMKCLNAQSYRNFQLFLMGDDYEDEEEFREVAAQFRVDQAATGETGGAPAGSTLYVENVQPALERSRCQVRRNLWAIGGANTLNAGIRRAREQSFTHYAHIDDDDVWHPHHLLMLATAYHMFPDASAVWTWGTMGHWKLPESGIIGRNNFLPVVKLNPPGQAFHSTLSYRLDTVTFEYETLRENDEPEKEYRAADAVHTEAIGRLAREGRAVIVAVPVVTCTRLSEGSILET